MKCIHLFLFEPNFSFWTICLLLMLSSRSSGDILTGDFMVNLQEAQPAIQDHKTMVQNLTEAWARVATLEAELEIIKNRESLIIWTHY